LDEAASLEQEALAMRRKLLPEEHSDVAKSLYLVGDRMRQQGKLNEAYPVLMAALSIQRKLLGEDNPASLDSLRSLGSTLEAEGKLAEAETMHREALGLWRKRGESETPQALSEVESLVHVLVAQKKLGEAEQLLGEALTPAFTQRPSSVKVLALRIDLLTRQGRWPEAATDAALALDHQPANHERYHTLAPLLAITHNRLAYDQLCRRILATFADATNASVADQMAKDCLLLPPSGVDLQLISHLADTAVTARKDDWAMPFFQVCKALSEYRQENFRNSVEWAQTALKRSDVPYLSAYAYAVLAMADWQLGEKDAAREMLAKGNTLTPNIFPGHEAEDNGAAWSGWIFARILLDEAAAVVESR
jgi:tetratricopeptide (TPR) repeat protein